MPRLIPCPLCAGIQSEGCVGCKGKGLVLAMVPAPMLERYPVALATHLGRLVVLANDGTIWRDSQGIRWVQVADLPQPEADDAG